MLFALFIYISAVPGANTAAIDTNLQFKNAADCEVARAAVEKAIQAGAGYRGSVTCIPLTKPKA